jgi:peroxiredoxin
MQPVGLLMVTDLRKVWKSRTLLLAMVVTVPGVLMLLQHWGYRADWTTTPAMPMSSRSIVAPDFSLRDLDGTRRDVASFRGRVVLLHFWTTWCKPCQPEMLSMVELHQTYQDAGLEVVAVASDVQGVEVVQPFVDRRQLRFITLLDTVGQVTRLYGVTSLPTTYLLDREGRIVTVKIGGYDWAQADARALITSLLGPAPQASAPRNSGAM